MKTKDNISEDPKQTSGSLSKKLSLSDCLKQASIDRAHRVFYLLTDKRTKLYCYFLESTIPIFNTSNLLMQRDDPCIHRLFDSCQNLLTDIYVRFVTPLAVMNVELLQDVKYKDRKNQKDREGIMIGTKTRNYLNECKANDSMSKDDRTEFFDSVRKYFITAADYIIDKFPLNKDFVKHAEVADVKIRNKVTFDSVKYFVDKLPCLSDIRNNCMDELQMEFLRYQVKELPKELSSVTKRIDTV